MKLRNREVVLSELPVAKRRRRNIAAAAAAATPAADAASASAHAAAPAAHLPSELLVRVLQLVEQRQHLAACSLVCSAWRDAAAAATTSLSAVVKGAASMCSVSAWLARHRLPALSLAGVYTAARQRVSLPCSQLALQQLQLDFLQLTRHPGCSCSSSGGQACAALSRLTSLRLDRATLCSCPQGGRLCCVSSLAGLQQLHVRSMSANAIASIFAAGRQQQQQQQGQCAEGEVAVAALVLPQLTQLHLAHVYYGESLPCLSGLRGLRELHLGLSSSEAKANLAHLPHSLTRVEVDHTPGTAFSSSSSLTRGSEQLTGLRHLRLNRVESVEPSLLSGMVQLTRLQLVVPHCSSEMVERLLHVLPSMQRLQLLHVEGRQQRYYGPPVSAWQLSALLSSPQLASVVLRDAGCLPAAAGQAMFPPGRSLPGLRQLAIHYRRPAGAASEAAESGTGSAAAAAAAPFGADDVASLACCCPGLVQLELAGVLQPGLGPAGLQALAGLPCLTRVLLDGQPWQGTANGVDATA